MTSEASREAEALFARVQGRPGAVWLDGGREGRHVVAWDPAEVVAVGAGWPDAGRRLTRAEARGDGFSGVIGFVGYGAGHRVEDVPPEARAWEPEVWLARYEAAAVWDGRWTVSGGPGFRAECEAGLRSGALPPPPDAPRVRSRTVDRAVHEASVRRILGWIAEGDCYQVNLTRPVWLDGVGPAFETYRRLRARSDASKGAFLRLEPELAVLSNSPETLLEVRGRRLFTDPIKGTRPRGSDAAEDARLRAELDASEKDRAELAMIVDLARNDLGRVAVAGSVRAGVRRLAAHAGVIHASWPVEAELRPDRDGWDALAAVFPPGSVTGCPKVRACQRITSLEADPRGVYCGAIGFAADGGDMAWSVAIRTAVQRGSEARYHVGGGVVYDSDPASEWDETVHKGRNLAAAFGA